MSRTGLELKLVTLETKKNPTDMHVQFSSLASANNLRGTINDVS